MSLTFLYCVYVCARLFRCWWNQGLIARVGRSSTPLSPRARYVSVTALYAARSMARYVAVWLVRLESPVLLLGQCHCGYAGMCARSAILSMCICIDGVLVTHSGSCDLCCLCPVQVRDLINSDGESLTEVQPGHPVGIIGLKVCTASYRDL